MSVLGEEIKKARREDEMSLVERASKAALARYAAGEVRIESLDYECGNAPIYNSGGFARMVPGVMRTKVVLRAHDGATITIEA